MAFASNKNAYAICDRCGFRYGLRELRKEWNGLKTCPECYESKHPQLNPVRKVADPQAVREPRPDISFIPTDFIVRTNVGLGIIGSLITTPTQITSFQEFEEMFGGVDERFYTPYTQQQYLQSAGVVTIVRILGLAGYQADSVQLVAKDSTTSHSLAILAPSRGSSGAGDLSHTNVQGAGTWDSFTLQVSGSNVTAETYALSFNTSSANFITDVISDDPQSQKSGNSNSSVYVYKVFKTIIF